MDERQQRQVIDQLVRQAERVEATMTTWFRAEAERLTAFRDEMRVKHRENLERLDSIESKQDITNGRVATHDALIKYVIPAVIGAVTVTAAVIIWILTLIGKL